MHYSVDCMYIQISSLFVFSFCSKQLIVKDDRTFLVRKTVEHFNVSFESTRKNNTNSLFSSKIVFFTFVARKAFLALSMTTDCANCLKRSTQAAQSRVQICTSRLISNRKIRKFTRQRFLYSTAVWYVLVDLNTILSLSLHLKMEDVWTVIYMRYTSEVSR